MGLFPRALPLLLRYSVDAPRLFLPLGFTPLPCFLTVTFKADTIAHVAQALAGALPLVAARAEGAQIIPVAIIGWRLAQRGPFQGLCISNVTVRIGSREADGFERHPLDNLTHQGWEVSRERCSNGVSNSLGNHISNEHSA